MIDLCVINFDTCDKLLRLFDTLEFNPDLFNLWIADNGSTDGSHLFPEFRPPGGRYQFVQNENVGYSAACNQLAAMGTGDIVALLNADIWFTAQDLEKIQAIFDQDPTIGVFGPKQRNENHQIKHGGIVGTNTAPKHRGWNELDPGDVLYKNRVECVTVSGSAYFVRRTVWDELTNCEVYRTLYPEATGAFLPTPHYYEETWCSYHATAHGYKIIYDGSVSIGHTWHASSPWGGEADQKFQISQEIFRKMCDFHNIPRD